MKFYLHEFASLVFLAGMFFCTAIKNVPLNDKLASFNDSLSPEIEWNYYYENWTMWNHVYFCLLLFVNDYSFL